MANSTGYKYKGMRPLDEWDRDDGLQVVTVSEYDSETEVTYSLTMAPRYRVVSVGMEGRALGYREVGTFPLRRLIDKATLAWQDAYLKGWKS